jgi:hypothetical protein
VRLSRDSRTPLCLQGFCAPLRLRRPLWVASAPVSAGSSCLPRSSLAEGLTTGSSALGSHAAGKRRQTRHATGRLRMLQPHTPSAFPLATPPLPSPYVRRSLSVSPGRFFTARGILLPPGGDISRKVHNIPAAICHRGVTTLLIRGKPRLPPPCCSRERDDVDRGAPRRLEGRGFDQMPRSAPLTRLQRTSRRVPDHRT